MVALYVENMCCSTPKLLSFEEFCKPPLDLNRISTLYAKSHVAAHLRYNGTLHVVAQPVSFLRCICAGSATLLEP